MTTDLHMRIGSVTKTFVITAVLQLVDQGKIGLDDPIDKYVTGVPDGKAITIRQLAGMRSGLFNFGDVVVPKIASEPNRNWTPRELLAIAFAHPRLFAPGKAFDYSNTNTVLLGLAIEKISGQPIEAYIEQQILRPEHLIHTVFPQGAAFPAPRAQGYSNTTPDGKIVNATKWNSSWAWTAGQMISTLDDLHVWVRDVATGTLLTPATQRQRTRFLPSEPEATGTGLGLEIDNGWIGHGGSLPGYMTQVRYLPSQRTTMVVLTNSNVNPLGFVALIRAITKVVSPDHVWPTFAQGPIAPANKRR